MQKVGTLSIEKQAIQNKVQQFAGSDRRLDPNELQQLANTLAAELRVPVSTFGELKMLFWRYDFSGTGYLDLKESVALIEGMMRAAKDARDPSAARAGMLSTTQIPNKRMEAGYEVSKKLGQGGQGAVYLARDRLNNQEKVVKLYDKSCQNAPADDVIDEFALLTRLDHPKIARTYEIFQDAANIYVVSEPYFGGDLSTAVEKAQGAGVQLTEGWFAAIWKQSCQGIAFLHSNGVMHCDIKEPNIMISSKDNWTAPNVVVIDFGLAQNFNAGSMAAGTPGYMPPEVWSAGLWTPKGDTFAMGVTFYTMITFGRRPFSEGATSIEQIKAITANCRLPSPKPPQLQQMPLLNALLERMLARDFHQRPVIAKVLEDPWFSQATGTQVSMDSQALQNMAGLRRKSDLHKALLADLASKENLAQMEELSGVFAAMDSDNDGTIDADEARRGLAGRMPAAEIENLIECLIGPSGKVAYTQFMGEMIAARKGDSKQMLWQIFQELDADNSGYLDIREVGEMMKKDIVAEALGGRSPQQVMQQMDSKGRGQVSFADFRAALDSNEENCKYRKGDAVEYYSPSYNQWVPCQVDDARPDGSIIVGCKPGFWITPQNQDGRVRAAGGGSSSSPGQQLLAAAMNF